MSDARVGSSWYLWLIAVVLLFAAAWFLTPLPMFVGITITMNQIRRVEARLQQAEIYLPVATNVALYCQSSEELHLANTVGALRLPQPLPSLGSPWASFQTNFAHVEFGGGFYHYGYRVYLDEGQSGPITNLWRLVLCREGKPEKLLHRFALASGDRVSLAQFTGSSIAEYDRHLAQSPSDLDLHRAKISLLLQYKPEAVRAACIDAVKAMPRHWWPRLTLALVDTGKGNYNQAASELIQFTESKPSYSRYLYLAYFYQLNEKPREAAQSIDKAIWFPIVDLDDDQTNTECRGYSVGVYVFQSGEYQTVIRLCDALLPVQENGNYAKTALRDLKSAAESAINGSRVNFTPSAAVMGFNPYEKMDVQKLLSK